ncbi:MAG: hypothetical protein RLZZ293_297 [Pseudomonadota bacterium]|jgi:uncharacterized protein (DUF58 family)
MTQGIIPQLEELLAYRHYAEQLDWFKPSQVSSANSGNMRSHLRGRGMDFAEVRRYQFGDDIRLIHWPLSARSGKIYTKVYHEERERAIYLVIDQSLSMQFATRVAFKNVIAARLGALLGWSALNYQQQVGGIIFNDTHLHYVKPRRSRQALLELFHGLTSTDYNYPHGGLTASLGFLLPQISSGSIVIIISDFNQLDPIITQQISYLSHQAQVINLLIYDPLEAQLPNFNQVNFSDRLAQRFLKLNVNRQIQQQYAQIHLNRQQALASLSKQQHMHYLNIATNDDLLLKLQQGVN